MGENETSKEGSQRPPIFLESISDESEELEPKEIYLPQTVIKCKICNDIFYIKHAEIHTCFQNEIKLDNKENKRKLKPKNKVKKLNFDKKCGVINNVTNESCQNSLKCKLHSFQEKECVVGRSRTLDVLLKKEADLLKSTKTNKTEPTIQIDEDLLESVRNIKPVVNKIWYNPEYKFDSLAMRSMIHNPLKAYILLKSNKKSTIDKNEKEGI